MLLDCKIGPGYARAWLRRATDREVVLPKLVTCVGTNLGKGAYPMTTTLASPNSAAGAGFCLCSSNLRRETMRHHKDLRYHSSAALSQADRFDEHARAQQISQMLAL